jgi:hypothetical protein
LADAAYNARNLVFAATAGAKTALNLIAGANQPISIFEWSVSMDGVTASAVPALISLEQSTQAGAGTGAASPPAVVQTSGRAITVQPTTAHNFTAEPSALTPIEEFYLAQFMGTLVKQYQLGIEPDTDLSGGTVKALAIRANVSANVNLKTYARFGIGG